MTLALTTDTIRANVRVSPSLSDSALQDVSDRLENLMLAMAGPHTGPLTQRVQNRQFAILERKAESVTSVHRIASDGSVDTDTALPFVFFPPTQVQPASGLWPAQVEITYTPLDTLDTRRLVLLQLINLELNQGFSQAPGSPPLPSTTRLRNAALMQLRSAERSGVVV